MARRTNQPKIDTPTTRKKLPPRHGVYWNLLSAGCALGYRHNSASRNGTWYAKYNVPKQARLGSGRAVRLQTKIGPADDVTTADGAICFSYEQARTKAIQWFPVATHKATGITPSRGGYTVEHACRDYLRGQEGHSRHVYETSKMIEANIAPHLGDALVEKLTRTRIEDWMKHLAENRRRKPRNGLDPRSAEALRRSKDTVNRNLRVLKAAQNFALNEGEVACNGMAWKTVKQFRNVSQARTRFLSDEEARKLAAACPPDFGFLVRGALFSGARYGELCRMQVCDFDSVSGTLLVATSKSGKPRRVYLDVEALRFFEDLSKNRGATELLFAQGDGAPWGKDSAQGLMAEATKAAEIEACSFHELRHSAASRWARLGLSLAEIADQLGHADLRMTMRYSHLCRKTLADKIRALPPLGIYESSEEKPTTIQ